MFGRREKLAEIWRDKESKPPFTIVLTSISSIYLFYTEYYMNGQALGKALRWLISRYVLIRDFTVWQNTYVHNN